jgi:hypothetical protein
MIEDMNPPNQVIRSHYRKASSSVRDRFILCTETATNNISTDYSSGKAVDNLLNYGRRLSAITDGYLNAQQADRYTATRSWSSGNWLFNLYRRCFSLRLGKLRVIELGIHRDLLNDDFLRRNGSVPKPRGGLGYRQNPGLQNKGDLEAVHRAVVAVVDFYGVVCAVEPPGSPLNFGFQEGLRIDPYVGHVSAL